jgi:hypothetical protein
VPPSGPAHTQLVLARRRSHYLTCANTCAAILLTLSSSWHDEGVITSPAQTPVPPSCSHSARLGTTKESLPHLRKRRGRTCANDKTIKGVRDLQTEHARLSFLTCANVVAAVRLTLNSSRHDEKSFSLVRFL